MALIANTLATIDMSQVKTTYKAAPEAGYPNGYTIYFFYDGNRSIIANPYPAGSPEAIALSKLASYNSGVDDGLSNDLLRQKIVEITTFEKSIIAAGVSTNTFGANFFKSQFNDKLSAPRLSDYQNWYSVKSASSTSGFDLSQITKQIDQAINTNPILQVMVPSLVVVNESLKHPVEAALIAFTAGGISTLLGPAIAAPVAVAEGAAAAAAPALGSVGTSIISTVEAAVVAAGTGAIKQGINNILGGRPSGPRAEVAPDTIEKPTGINPLFWLAPVALFFLT